jgi:hypothetical protein
MGAEEASEIKDLTAFGSSTLLASLNHPNIATIYGVEDRARAPAGK